jgi:hypothetical protein
MEELEQSSFIGLADYIDSQEDWRNLEWKSLNREFFTVVVDELLEFLWEYYMPL